MATIDSLPGDQRAVLQLVLGRARSYDEIAGLLSIDRDAVRDRALAATDALGPQTRIPAVNRQLISDYLLGQLPAQEIPTVRELLARSAPERGWANVLSRELAPMATRPLPEIPAALVPSSAPVAPDPAIVPAPVVQPSPAPRAAPAPAQPPPAPAPAQVPVPETEVARKPSRTQRRAAAAADGVEKARTSRRGGMVVIAISVIVIAVVIFVVVRRHHSHAITPSAHVTQTNPASATQTSSSTTSTSSAANPAGAKVITQVNLSAASAGSKAAAIADVLQEGSAREVAIVGQNVPANTKHNSYEVWLYNSPSDAVSLGFVNPGVSANGKLSAAGPLPTDASSYRKLIITTETVPKPKSPGPIVLSGAISGL